METLPKIVNGNGFAQMFKMQKALLKKYIVIEKLPEFPVDLSSRIGQSTIKKEAHRFMEELAEAYGDLEEALDQASINQVDKAKKLTASYNEEIADALHFLLEVLIYSGMEDEYIDFVLMNLLNEKGLDNFSLPGNILGTFFKLGNYLNYTYDIIVASRQEFQIYAQNELQDRPMLSGAMRLSVKGLKIHAEFSWHIVHKMLKVCNLLKNRDWSVEEKKVNEIQYQEKIINMLVVFFQYLAYAGVTEAGLFQAYVTKNEINYQRILNKY